MRENSNGLSLVFFFLLTVAKLPSTTQMGQKREKCFGSVANNKFFDLIKLQAANQRNIISIFRFLVFPSLI